MTQEPTVVPAARRLRRLRWMMTVAFTVANVAGLVALATVALKVDTGSRRKAEVSEVRHRARTAAELSFTDEGELYTEWLSADEVADGHPEVYVLVRHDDQLTVGFSGRNRTCDIPLRWLRQAASQAMAASPHRVTVKARDAHDHAVFLVAVPIFDGDGGGEPSGAAIAVGDPDAGAAEHLRLTWALIAGTVVLALVSAALGHTLSGRSVRPAITNLTDHERLLADAAHELRTPVAALRAAAETAIAETRTNGAPPIDAVAYRAHLDTVLRHTLRLGSVLDALLTRARLAAGSQAIGREPLRLDLLAEDTIAEVCGDLAIPPEQVVIEAEPSVVEADPALLRLALRNLLENAIQHGRRPEAPTRLRVEVAGRSIAVHDNGPGVPPEQLGAPFARYSSRTGNGLGLSIAADVAAAHGGRLDVRNASEGGAVFTITLA